MFSKAGGEATATMSTVQSRDIAAAKATLTTDAMAVTSNLEKNVEGKDCEGRLEINCPLRILPIQKIRTKLNLAIIYH